MRLIKIISFLVVGVLALVSLGILVLYLKNNRLTYRPKASDLVPVTIPFTARASNTLTGYPAGYALDRKTGTFWNSGKSATQWLELDLGKIISVAKIRLLVQQTPGGKTKHVIYAGSSPNPTAVIATFASVTQSGLWLTADLTAKPVQARYVRVLTSESPSWIAWAEIEIYSTDAARPVDAGRIAIRTVDGHREFYNSATGSSFVPRGNNYIRLSDQNGLLYHSTFNPGQYDPGRAERSLNEMKSAGYNTVRVFINNLSVGDARTGGLSQTYLDNFTDYLNLAKKTGLYVLPVFNVIPDSGGYYPPDNPLFEGYNRYMLSKDFVVANQRFINDFMTAIKTRNAPLETIFAYSIWNEAFYRKDQKPLSLNSGMITTANGHSYNMAVATDKQQMMDANLVNYINAIYQIFKRNDPAGLVTVGFFTPESLKINPKENRVIRTKWAIENPDKGGSNADFIDIHIYPGFPNFNLAREISSLELPQTRLKPLLLGEFGAIKSDYGTSFTSAKVSVPALVKLQSESCRLYGFTGWLLWTWDTDEQTEVYNALSENGLINQALAPLYRSDPCK